MFSFINFHIITNLSLNVVSLLLIFNVNMGGCEGAYSPSSIVWQRGHATFYGGSDASGTMGKFTHHLLHHKNASFMDIFSFFFVTFLMHYVNG